jgi:hypothetical protein
MTNITNERDGTVINPHTDEQIFLDKFSFTSLICSCVWRIVDKETKKGKLVNENLSRETCQEKLQGKRVKENLSRKTGE